MCYNCGCGLKDDDMGDVRNITITDLAKDAHVKDKNGESYLKALSLFLDGVDVSNLDQTIVTVKNSENSDKLTDTNIDLTRLAKGAIASQMNAAQTLNEVMKLLHQTTPQELDQKIAALHPH